MSVRVKTEEGWKKVAGNASSSGGGGGTSDYNELSNKPQINSVELSGNKSLTELNIASASDLQNLSDIVGTVNAMLEGV